jgi:mannosyltransferase
VSHAPAGQQGRQQAAATAGPGAPEPAASGPAPRAGSPGRLVEYLPVMLVAATMVVMGLWGLKRHSSMGNDEVVTRWAALLPLHELLHYLSHVDAVHGFYYFLLHAWMAVGNSPAVIRVPSVIAMVIAVALVAILGTRLTGSVWPGLFAGLIMTFTPAITFYAQTARSYALVVATVAGATLTLLHAMQGETTGVPGRSIARRWAGYGALVALAGYLNEMALLMLAAHLVTILLARYGRQVLRHWFIAAALGTLLVTPLLLVSAREANEFHWIPYPHLSMLPLLLHDYFGGLDLVAVLLFCCAVAAVLPPIRRSEATVKSAAGAANASEGDKQELPWWRCGGVSLPSVAAPLMVLPAWLLVLESRVARPLYVDRYVLYAEAGAALLAGGGIYRIGRRLSSITGKRVLLVVPGMLICALTLGLQLGNQRYVRSTAARQFDYGGPSSYVAAHARAGDGILYFTDFFRKAELGYPQDFSKVTDFSQAESPAVAGFIAGTDKPLSVVRSLMVGFRRIWVLGRPPAAPLPAGHLTEEKLWLIGHFSLVTEVRFRGVVVSLWVRNASSG